VVSSKLLIGAKCNARSLTKGVNSFSGAPTFSPLCGTEGPKLRAGWVRLWARTPVNREEELKKKDVIHNTFKKVVMCQKTKPATGMELSKGVSSQNQQKRGRCLKERFGTEDS